MMYLILISCLFASALSQGRSSYAGTRIHGVPDMHRRFTTVSDASNNETTQSTNAVGNRAETDQSTSSTERIPVDARGDANLVNRLKTWPEENQPFWLKNFDHIEKHRGPVDGGVQNQQLSGSRDPQASSRTASNRQPSVDPTSVPLDRTDQQRIQSRSATDFDKVREVKSSRRNSY